MSTPNNKKPPKVSINIVTWNSLRYLPECLESVFNQTFRDFSVLAIDNSSMDGSAGFVMKNYPQAKISRNSRNLGFARAHNQGIGFSQGEYILIVNPDIVMAPSCLEELVKAMDGDPKLGSVGGKLLKMQAHKFDLPYVCGMKTNFIDSTGLEISESRKVTDRGQGEKDQGQYDKKEEVFGISGALILCRRKALEDVKVGSECFDRDFFSYKEDIDLAWRMRLFGWKSVYAPKAVAYHHRGVGLRKKAGLKETREKRKGRSKPVRYYSYKNHLAMLVKNSYWANAWQDFRHILWYEFKKLAFIIFFEPATLKAPLGFLKDLPKIMKKRKAVMARAKVSPAEMRRWWKRAG